MKTICQNSLARDYKPSKANEALLKGTLHGGEAIEPGTLHNHNCPFITSYQRCKLYDTYQEGYHFREFCLSPDGKWLRCPNYEAYHK